MMGHAKNYCTRQAVGAHAQNPQRFRPNCAACRGSPLPSVAQPVAALAPVVSIPVPVSAPVPRGHTVHTFMQSLSIPAVSSGTTVASLTFDLANLARANELHGWHSLITLSEVVVEPLLDESMTGTLWLAFDPDSASADLATMTVHEYSERYLPKAPKGPISAVFERGGLRYASRRLHDRAAGVPALKLNAVSSINTAYTCRVRYTVWAANRFREGPPAVAAWNGDVPADGTHRLSQSATNARFARFRLPVGGRMRENTGVLQTQAGGGWSNLQVRISGSLVDATPTNCPGLEALRPLIPASPGLVAALDIVIQLF